MKTEYIFFCLIMAAIYAAPGMAERSRNMATVTYLVMATVAALVAVYRMVMA